MIEFKTVAREDASKLRKYYQDCNYGLCEYSVGTKLMWRKTLNPAWAEVAGCLVMRYINNGKWSFDYPVPGPEGDEEAALEAIEACAAEGLNVAATVSFTREMDRINAQRRTAPYRFRCEVCGRTDVTDPQLDFRYCSRCAGYHCYCLDHINAHQHFTQ